MLRSSITTEDSLIISHNEEARRKFALFLKKPTGKLYSLFNIKTVRLLVYITDFDTFILLQFLGARNRLHDLRTFLTERKMKNLVSWFKWCPCCDIRSTVKSGCLGKCYGEFL